jgi:hypothetical protein
LGDCKKALWSAKFSKGYLTFMAYADLERILGAQITDATDYMSFEVNGKFEVTAPNDGELGQYGSTDRTNAGRFTIRLEEESNTVRLHAKSSTDWETSHMIIGALKFCPDAEPTGEVCDGGVSYGSWKKRADIAAGEDGITVEYSWGSSRGSSRDVSISNGYSAALQVGIGVSLMPFGLGTKSDNSLTNEYSYSDTRSKSSFEEDSKGSALSQNVKFGEDIAAGHASVQYIADMGQTGGEVWQWIVEFDCTGEEITAKTLELLVLPKGAPPPCCVPGKNPGVRYYGHYCNKNEDGNQVSEGGNCLPRVYDSSGNQVSNSHCWVGNPITQKHDESLIKNGGNCASLELSSEMCAASGSADTMTKCDPSEPE